MQHAQHARGGFRHGRAVDDLPLRHRRLGLALGKLRARPHELLLLALPKEWMLGTVPLLLQFPCQVAVRLEDLGRPGVALALDDAQLLITEALHQQRQLRDRVRVGRARLCQPDAGELGHQLPVVDVGALVAVVDKLDVARLRGRLLLGV